MCILWCVSLVNFLTCQLFTLCDVSVVYTLWCVSCVHFVMCQSCLLCNVSVVYTLWSVMSGPSVWAQWTLWVSLCRNSILTQTAARRKVRYVIQTFLWLWLLLSLLLLLLIHLLSVLVGSPSQGGDVVAYVFNINQPSLPTPFYSVLVTVSVFMALLTVFLSINSPDISTFSLCASGLISALLVLSAICLFMEVSLNPDLILCGWLGWKHHLNN